MAVVLASEYSQARRPCLGKHSSGERIGTSARPGTGAPIRARPPWRRRINAGTPALPCSKYFTIPCATYALHSRLGFRSTSTPRISLLQRTKNLYTFYYLPAHQ